MSSIGVLNLSDVWFLLVSMTIEYSERVICGTQMVFVFPPLLIHSGTYLSANDLGTNLSHRQALLIIPIMIYGNQGKKEQEP